MNRPILVRGECRLPDTPPLFVSYPIFMFQTGQLLQNLLALGERQLDTETAATELIADFLKSLHIPFSVQTFPIHIPKTRFARLTVDGFSVECEGTSFTSGVIPDKDIILSSAMAMADSPDVANINFNPFCSAISRGNHYLQPSVAVSHRVLQKILAGNIVRGTVDVEIVSHDAHNILVGNSTAPRRIVCTHYDSIGPGAFDNASGAISTLEAILRHRAILEDTLFVFSGAEELSTDRPFYWGAGYRRFQDQFPKMMNDAADILVIDSVGSGSIQMVTDARILARAFPLNHLEDFTPRTSLITGHLPDLMTVYHSPLDTIDRLAIASINRATDMLLGICKKQIEEM